MRNPFTSPQWLPFIGALLVLFALIDIRQLAVPFASIGGTGTFDGIFLTGLVVLLLT